MRYLLFLFLFPMAFGMADEQLKDWQKRFEAYGCGAYAARIAAQTKVNTYAGQCQKQGGSATGWVQNRPFCWPPNPNDLKCQRGDCYAKALVNCKFE